MLLAAFGVSLGTLMSIADRVVLAKDVQVVLMALTAGVQIRAHVTFVGRDFGQVRVKYPELVIEGARPQTDIYNFGALHALGHLFSHLSGHSLGDKILAKAGSCITGEKITANEAGVINKQFADSWTQDDREAWRTWTAANQTVYSAFVRPIVASVSPKSAGFATKLGRPAVGGRPATGAALLTQAARDAEAAAAESPTQSKV